MASCSARSDQRAEGRPGAQRHLHGRRRQDQPEGPAAWSPRACATRRREAEDAQRGGEAEEAAVEDEERPEQVQDVGHAQPARHCAPSSAACPGPPADRLVALGDEAAMLTAPAKPRATAPASPQRRGVVVDDRLRGQRGDDDGDEDVGGHHAVEAARPRAIRPTVIAAAATSSTAPRPTMTVTATCTALMPRSPASRPRPGSWCALGVERRDGPRRSRRLAGRAPGVEDVLGRALERRRLDGVEHVDVERAVRAPHLEDEAAGHERGELAGQGEDEVGAGPQPDADDRAARSCREKVRATTRTHRAHDVGAEPGEHPARAPRRTRTRALDPRQREDEGDQQRQEHTVRTMKSEIRSHSSAQVTSGRRPRPGWPTARGAHRVPPGSTGVHVRHPARGGRPPHARSKP